MAEKGPGVWTTTSLADALTASDIAERGELSTRRVEGAEPVLVAVMHEQGDLPIYISVAGEQIVVSTLLWPVAEQVDSAAFNHFLLKAQKAVPLSNFAITEVDGAEYYELIGELPASSSLEMIVLELRVLAENAIAAARDLREAFADAA